MIALTPDEKEILRFALESASPAGWGTPNDFDDMEDEEYVGVYDSLVNKMEALMAEDFEDAFHEYLTHNDEKG